VCVQLHSSKSAKERFVASPAHYNFMDQARGFIEAPRPSGGSLRVLALSVGLSSSGNPLPIFVRSLRPLLKQSGSPPHPKETVWNECQSEFGMARSHRSGGSDPGLGTTRLLPHLSTFGCEAPVCQRAKLPAMA
jgi:hypothetical protein